MVIIFSHLGTNKEESRKSTQTYFSLMFENNATDFLYSYKVKNSRHNIQTSFCSSV